MTPYNESVIRNIEDTANQYIAMHKRMPSIIMIGAYEHRELKKAAQCGVRPQVLFKGKIVTPNVSSEFKDPNDYDFMDFNKRKGASNHAIPNL